MNKLVILITTLTLLSVTKIYAQSFSYYYNQGVAFHNKNKYRQAIQAYSEAINLNPNHVNAYINRGGCKFNLGMYKEAVKDYDKVIGLNPNSAEAYNNRGECKKKLRLYRGAFIDFDKAIGINPNYAKAYYNRGECKKKLRLYKGAIMDYDKAIELNPISLNSYYGRLGCNKKLGYNLKVIEDYDRIIILNPNNGRLYYNRGDTKKEIGLYKEAIRDYNKAIELNFNNYYVYFDRGECKNNLTLYREAIKDFDKAINKYFRITVISENGNEKTSHPFFKGYLERGNSKRKLGLYREAIKDYNEAIQLSPKFAEDEINPKAYAYHYRGFCKARLRLHTAAIRDYGKAIGINPNYDEAYAHRGVSKRKLGFHREAISDYNKAIELNPNNSIAKYKLKLLKFIISYAKNTTQPNIWVVAVGLSNYQHKLMTPLNTPVKNAYDFARYFERFNLVNSEVPVLINNQAKKDNILLAIAQNFINNPKVEQNDMIIFYFSGHGVAAGNQPGICPYDYFTADQLITDNSIIDLLKKSPARHKICIIDACKTQAITQGPISNEKLSHFNEERRKIPGSIIYFTSSKVGQDSYEVPEIGTVFSHYLLKGITESKADDNEDGIIRIKELFNYVKSNVKNYTSGTQIPQINTEGYDSDLPIITYD